MSLSAKELASAYTSVATYAADGDGVNATFPPDRHAARETFGRASLARTVYSPDHP